MFFQALVGSGFGSIRHVSRQGFVVFTSAVRAPSHQAEYVTFWIPMIESRSPLLVQCLARITWSMDSPRPIPPTVSPSPSSSIHTSTGSTSLNLRYPPRATTSTSRPSYSMPLASCLDAYILPCIPSRTVPLGLSWVLPYGLFSTFTCDGLKRP